jgi:hypothetical protein
VLRLVLEAPQSAAALDPAVVGSLARDGLVVVEGDRVLVPT